ncbi:hypothetical protein M404DRAFT_145740, partial [Pisolithus tinctorius Marx 270]
RSKQNTRIERIWREVSARFAQIKADCMSFCEEWNSHPISGEGHDQSPRDMRLLGQLEHGVCLENGVSLNPDVVSHYYGLQHPANQPTSGDGSDDDGWEDIMDHSDMTADHSDLPSMIADDQASEFAHDGAAVPVEVDPFPSSNWQEVFWQALQHVHETGHVPHGYGMQQEEWGEEGYPELEAIPSGRRGQKEIIVELPDFIWQPRAIRWCQALEVLIHILETAN